MVSEIQAAADAGVLPAAVVVVEAVLVGAGDAWPQSGGAQPQND